MTRDYSRRAEPRQAQEKPRSPAWVPFFYGFFLGVLLTGAGWMVLTPPGTPLQLPEYLAAGKKESAPAKPTASEQNRPRFDFYTILPEMEVIVSEDEPEPVKPKIPQSATTTEPAAEPLVSYRLQAGSFKKMADADRQKAKLAFLGMEADIQRVTVASGETYYRVLTSAYTDRQELNGKQRLLQQNNINSLVVKNRN